MHLEGTPSDELPGVLATGRSDSTLAFVSLSARDPDGRDAEYLEWHTLDHRPEQYRVPGLRGSLRLVSTPACRAARAANAEQFDAVDHVMTYLFAGPEALPPFHALGQALGAGGRMPHRLPSVATLTATVAAKRAAARAVAGADVMPWRPFLGVYLVIENGRAPADSLVDLPGVAGLWTFQGTEASHPGGLNARGMQLTYCFLDEDPVEAATRLGEQVRRRWGSGGVEGLLAAPFYTATPFDWRRHLPG